MSWKARLRGHSFDLDTLTDMFREGEPTVGADDDCHYLRSSTFDGLTDVSAVKERAVELLDYMNGIARVLDPSYRNVELTGAFDGEDGRAVVIGAASASARTRAQAVGVVVGGEPQSPALPRGPKYVELAESDPDVAEAVGYIASGLDPARLYKVFEIIRHDVGNAEAMQRMGWVSSRAITRFTAGVNRPEAAGSDARHVRMRGDAPSDPMDPPQARRFLIDLTHKWMDSKLAQG